MYQTVSQVIDTRSFSSLWFWIVLVVFWSLSSHFVLGVPYDMVIRARRYGGEADQDLYDMVRVSTNRILYIVNKAAVLLICVAMFWLSIFVTLAFYYDIEFAQAMLCFYVPFLIISALSVRAARRIKATDPTGAVLQRRLLFHRLSIQALGMFFVAGTSLWGIWQNLHEAIF